MTYQSWVLPGHHAAGVQSSPCKTKRIKRQHKRQCHEIFLLHYLLINSFPSIRVLQCSPIHIIFLNSQTCLSPSPPPVSEIWTSKADNHFRIRYRTKLRSGGTDPVRIGDPEPDPQWKNERRG
jgi:hypothetical protein